MAKRSELGTQSRGARRRADIAADWLVQLNTGMVASRTLVEMLAVDQAALAHAVFPDLPKSTLILLNTLKEKGFLQRTRDTAHTLCNTLGAQATATCATHPSDTVRGWACFMLVQQTQIANTSAGDDLKALLARLQALAADAHFGVREWAWMAARPILARDVDEAVHALIPWAQSPEANLRRFASEALRPRGVWCAHIAQFKIAPERALALLENLKADPSEYVRLSVGNWLNDAAKTRPDWVRAICTRWQNENPSAQTAHICRRALRNLV